MKQPRDLNSNILGATTGRPSSQQFIQSVGICFLELGQKKTWILALLCPFLAAAGPMDDAFNESLYTTGSSGRGELTHIIETVKAYCGQVNDRSAGETKACEWPVLADHILIRMDELSDKARGSYARSARLAPANLDPVTLLNEGQAPVIRGFTQILDYLQYAQMLGRATEELKSSVRSIRWLVVNSVHPDFEDANTIISGAHRFQSYVQSENPLGYLRVLASLDPNQSKIRDELSACLAEPADIRRAIDNGKAVQARDRLLFKQVDIARAAWGQPVPGLLQSDRLVERPEDLVARLNTRVRDADLSLIGAELDECRALDWVLDAFHLPFGELKSVRLGCERARHEQSPLSLQIDPVIVFAERVILLIESQRERGTENSISARRAASLLRDLQMTRAGDAQCPDELKRRTQNIVKQLRQFIAAQIPEE